MEMCKENHDPIVHDNGKYCPLCAAIEENDAKYDTIKDLEKKNEELQDEIDNHVCATEGKPV